MNNIKFSDEIEHTIDNPTDYLVKAIGTGSNWWVSLVEIIGPTECKQTLICNFKEPKEFILKIDKRAKQLAISVNKCNVSLIPIGEYHESLY